MNLFLLRFLRYWVRAWLSLTNRRKFDVDAQQLQINEWLRENLEKIIINCNFISEGQACWVYIIYCEA